MDPLETLRQVVVFVHLTGFAVLFGSWAVEAYNRRIQVTPLMNIGLAIAGVAGLILAAPWGVSYDLNYTKIAVKLIVLLAIVLLILLGFGIVKLVALPFGGIGTAVSFFWGFLLVSVVLVVLIVLGRRRQKRARARAAEQRASQFR